jgi:SAM-dependent methyltransferase
MADTGFDEWIAERYEVLWPELFDPAVLEPAVDFLARLANQGPALEFGIGTGRLAVPLTQRGIQVHGIELSPAMAARVPRTIPVKHGDFARSRVDGRFSLVYLVRNTITNLTTPDEQVAAFQNAADHLEPGGCFVIENYIPLLERNVFTATPEHVAYEEYDLVDQIATSRHYWVLDGQLRTFESRHRYVWPAELDLMARLAGLERTERWADWRRRPFTGTGSHVSVWTKP